MQMVTVSISVPSPILESAEKLAQQMGLSRDELYAEALKLYLNARENQRQGDNAILQAGNTYHVWSPYDAFDAADTLSVLREEHVTYDV